MSPLCQIGMTLPADFAGGVWGDDTADERSGAFAVRGAAGFGSRPADGPGGGAIAAAGATSGIPAFASVPGRGCGRSDLEAPWSCEQPSQARGSSHRGAGDHSRTLLGFRPDPGGGEAGRAARDRAGSRDTAPMDDRGWAVA